MPTPKKTFIILSGQLAHQNVPPLEDFNPLGEIKAVLGMFKKNTTLVLQTNVLREDAIKEQKILADAGLVTEHIICYDDMHTGSSSIGYWDSLAQKLDVNAKNIGVKKEDLVSIAANVMDCTEINKAGVKSIDYGYFNKLNAKKELENTLNTRVQKKKKRVAPA